MPRNSLSQESTRRTDQCGFWIGLVAGWSAYLGINLLMIAIYEEMPMSEALFAGIFNVIPPAVVSIPVARYRRELLRPEWTLGRTIAVHVLVGVVFAVATAILAYGLVQTNETMRTMAMESPQFNIGFLVTSALFLYVIFFGFLMWSESMRRVQESHRLAAREAVLRAEAEARAIRAQFNPHFVFNTLHSLMLLVRADPALAERAIEDVATLIRYASIIQRRDLDAVPLAKELEIARRYVDLEQLRLQHRLDVDWAVDVDPDSVAIPAFALQTLVENAIKHGIEPVPEGGRVEISVTMESDQVEVRVRDDGLGAEGGAVTGATGRGLDLLRGRIQARHGEAGGLSWATWPGQGFEVVMRLPHEEPDAVPALDVIEARGSRSVPEGAMTP